MTSHNPFAQFPDLSQISDPEPFDWKGGQGSGKKVSLTPRQA